MCDIATYFHKKKTTLIHGVSGKIRAVKKDASAGQGGTKRKSEEITREK